MSGPFVVIRSVSREECPWLRSDLSVGARVFAYYGCTYGCISPTGVAVTNAPDTEPFFEVPLDAIARAEQAEKAS